MSVRLSRLGGVVSVLALSLVLGSCGATPESLAPEPSGAPAHVREAAASRALADVAAALRDGDTAVLDQVGIGTGREQLRQMSENIGRLGLSDVELRFVAAREAGLDAAEEARYGALAWIGQADLTYRLPDWDGSATRVTVDVAFVPATGEQVVAGIGADGRVPLWLSGPFAVKADPAARTLVIAPVGSGERYARLARRAVVRVRQVLPDWSGPLVVEVPQTAAQLDAALDATPTDGARSPYAAIAAVTATTDGSQRADAPVHVFINPEVFGRLGERGAGVVMAHEATHVATGAAWSAMPTWLLEGFADYVALADGSVPVRTAAGQALARIRSAGPPDHLPTAAELSPTAPGLGATYEQAWLAVRFIAERYGQAALVALYRAVDDGTEVDRAFEQILGTSQSDFVVLWAEDVFRLAQSVRDKD